LLRLALDLELLALPILSRVHQLFADLLSTLAILPSHAMERMLHVPLILYRTLLLATALDRLTLVDLGLSTSSATEMVLSMNACKDHGLFFLPPWTALLELTADALLDKNALAMEINLLASPLELNKFANRFYVDIM